MRAHAMMFPLALAGSVTVHLVAAGQSPEATAPQLAGGEVAGEVALGSSFADLVAGVAVPVTVPVTGAAQAAAPVAGSVHPTTVTAPAHSPTVPVTASVTPAIAPVVSKAATAVVAVASVAPSPRPEAVAVRNEPIKTVVKAVKETKPEVRALRETAPVRGNASQNAAAGRLDGQATGQAATSSGARESTATQVGGKEMKRYHALVLRRIDRTPKRSAGAKGATLVGLGIAADGGIAMLRVLQSSGSATVDQVALDQVRRAGPFDPTPTAAQINLSLKVESKG